MASSSEDGQKHFRLIELNGNSVDSSPLSTPTCNSVNRNVLISVQVKLSVQFPSRILSSGASYQSSAFDPRLLDEFRSYIVALDEVGVIRTRNGNNVGNANSDIHGSQEHHRKNFASSSLLGFEQPVTLPWKLFYSSNPELSTFGGEAALSLWLPLPLDLLNPSVLASSSSSMARNFVLSLWEGDLVGENAPRLLTRRLASVPWVGAFSAVRNKNFKSMSWPLWASQPQPQHRHQQPPEPYVVVVLEASTSFVAPDNRHGQNWPGDSYDNFDSSSKIGRGCLENAMTLFSIFVWNLIFKWKLFRKNKSRRCRGQSAYNNNPRALCGLVKSTAKESPPYSSASNRVDQCRDGLSLSNDHAMMSVEEGTGDHGGDADGAQSRKGSNHDAEEIEIVRPPKVVRCSPYGDLGFISRPGGSPSSNSKQAKRAQVGEGGDYAYVTGGQTTTPPTGSGVNSAAGQKYASDSRCTDASVEPGEDDASVMARQSASPQPVPEAAVVNIGSSGFHHDTQFGSPTSSPMFQLQDSAGDAEEVKSPPTKESDVDLGDEMAQSEKRHLVVTTVADNAKNGPKEPSEGLNQEMQQQSHSHFDSTGNSNKDGGPSEVVDATISPEEPEKETAEQLGDKQNRISPEEKQRGVQENDPKGLAIAQKSNEREMGFSTTMQPAAVLGNCEEGDNDEELYADEFGARAFVAIRSLVLGPSVFAAAGKKRSFDSIGKDVSVRADAPAKQPLVDGDQDQAKSECPDDRLADAIYDSGQLPKNRTVAEDESVQSVEGLAKEAYIGMNPPKCPTRPKAHMHSMESASISLASRLPPSGKSHRPGRLQKRGEQIQCATSVTLLTAKFPSEEKGNAANQYIPQQGRASPSHSYVSTLPPSSDASQDRPDLVLHRFRRGNTSTNHLSEIWKKTEEDEVVFVGTNKERKGSNLAERATPGEFLSSADRSHSQKRSNLLPQNATSRRKRSKTRRRRLAEDPLPEIVPSVSLLSAAQGIRAPVWEFGSYDLAAKGETI